jgi:integrase
VSDTRAESSRVRMLQISQQADGHAWAIELKTETRVYRLSVDSESLVSASQLALSVIEQFIDREVPLQMTGADAHRKELAPISGVSFYQVALEFLESERGRVRQGGLAKESLRIMTNRLEAVICPVLGELPMASIPGSLLVNLRSSLIAKYSTVTVHQYFVLVRKIFRFAVEMGYIHEPPALPLIDAKGGVRSPFSAAEYAQLMRHAKLLIGQYHPAASPELVKKRGIRQEHLIFAPDTYAAIRFMVNGFLRPGDLRLLRHRHVSFAKQKDLHYLKLTSPTNKGHSAPVVTLVPAVRAYEWLTRQRPVNPDDYVFLPQVANRKYALSVLGFQFEWLLNELGLRLDQNGRPRTLYSLRHTAIMLRLLYGKNIDLLTLARNARTSVDMLNRFYASTLVPEQNIEMLQSRR